MQPKSKKATMQTEYIERLFPFFVLMMQEYRERTFPERSKVLDESADEPVLQYA